MRFGRRLIGNLGSWEQTGYGLEFTVWVANLSAGWRQRLLLYDICVEGFDQRSTLTARLHIKSLMGGTLTFEGVVVLATSNDVVAHHFEHRRYFDYITIPLPCWSLSSNKRLLYCCRQPRELGLSQSRANLVEDRFVVHDRRATAERTSEPGWPANAHQYSGRHAMMLRLRETAEWRRDGVWRGGRAEYTCFLPYP